jgi:hypothetical protein
MTHDSAGMDREASRTDSREQRAIAVLDAHRGELMSHPGVVGVGLGRNWLGRLCVQLYVLSNVNVDRALPKRVDGLPVVTRKVGEIVAG